MDCAIQEDGGIHFWEMTRYRGTSLNRAAAMWSKCPVVHILACFLKIPFSFHFILIKLDIRTLILCHRMKKTDNILKQKVYLLKIWENKPSELNKPVHPCLVYVQPPKLWKTGNSLWLPTNLSSSLPSGLNASRYSFIVYSMAKNKSSSGFCFSAMRTQRTNVIF